MVFMAFMQQCIQSNGTQSLMLKESKVYSALYTGPLTLQEGRLIVTISPVFLVVHQSEEAAFYNFLGLINYKGNCRQDAQPTPNS